MHRHAAHGAQHEGLAGLVAEQVRPVAVEQVKNHPRFKYFSEAGEDAYQSFLGVPLIDRGVLQGVLVVQTVEPRIFREDEVRMLIGGGRAGRAGRQRSPHSWTASLRRPGTAVGAGAQSVVELGPRFHQPVPRSRSGALARAEPQSRSRCWPRFRSRQIERRAGELVLHSRINYAYRRQQEYLRSRPHLGRTHAGVLRPRPVAYFSAEFGLHESHADLFRRPGRARRAITSRAPRIWAFRWSASACSTGRDISASVWTATAGSRKNTSKRRQPAADGAGHRDKTASRSWCRSKRAAALIHAKVWRMKVGRCDLFLLDSNVEGNAPEDRELTSRLYGGDGRIRIRQELLLGVGGFRALRPWASRRAFCI